MVPGPKIQGAMAGETYAAEAGARAPAASGSTPAGEWWATYPTEP